MLIIRIICIIGLLFSIACNPKTRETENTSPAGQSETNIDKTKIKAFWDAYRTAQDYRNEGSFSEAREYYLKALEIDPDHEDALFNLGNVCYELGKYPESESAWKKLIKVNYQNTRAHFQLGNLYLRMEIPEYFDLEKAEQEFQSAAKLNIVITGPMLHLGQIELIRNQVDSAKFYFQSITSTNAKGVEAYFHLGYLHWKSGNEAKAIENFSKAVKVSDPEKAIKGVLSEGDTKGGKSLTRPINESLFADFLINLNEIDSANIKQEMILHYQKQDKYLKQIRENVIQN
jgi:tetratricopeptide (TPR) repeat protein